MGGGAYGRFEDSESRSAVQYCNLNLRKMIGYIMEKLRGFLLFSVPKVHSIGLCECI
jgi:hypothetical protein